MDGERKIPIFADEYIRDSLKTFWVDTALVEYAEETIGMLNRLFTGYRFAYSVDRRKNILIHITYKFENMQKEMLLIHEDVKYYQKSTDILKKQMRMFNRIVLELLKGEVNKND